MATKQVTKAYDESAEFPESWIWEDDGPLVSGRFVRFDRGRTKDYGDKVIVVLDVDGEQRSVWLMTTVLHGKLHDELEQRPGHRLESGERITIKRRQGQERERDRCLLEVRRRFPRRARADGREPVRRVQRRAAGRAGRGAQAVRRQAQEDGAGRHAGT
jgi:hypothetical protein